MSERDGGEGDLEWCSVMEECKRELSCVGIKMAQAVGWQPRRPCRPHAPKPGEKRKKAMRTSRAGPHFYKVQHNVQDSAYQYFVLILLSAKVYNTYIFAGKYSTMYYSFLSLICIYPTKGRNTL